jgi:hypothetical protein
MSARYLSQYELAEAGLMMRLFCEGQRYGLDVERMMKYAEWWNTGSSIAQVDKRRAYIKAWALRCLRDYVAGARA